MTTSSRVESDVRPGWQAASGRDTATVSVGPTGKLTSITATWRATVNFLVPVGYEDEAGFHFGEMPKENDSNLCDACW